MMPLLLSLLLAACGTAEDPPAADAMGADPLQPFEHFDVVVDEPAPADVGALPEGDADQDGDVDEDDEAARLARSRSEATRRKGAGIGREAEAHHKAGRLLKAKSGVQEMLGYFKEAIAQDPTHRRAWEDYHRALTELKANGLLGRSVAKGAGIDLDPELERATKALAEL